MPIEYREFEFAYAGCLSMMHRKDMKNHLEVAKQEHKVLLSGNVEEMEVENLDRLKPENTAKDMKIRMLTVSSEHVAEKSAAQSQSTAKVLVMNFPSEADNYMIKSIFEQYGRVRHVMLYTREGWVTVVEYMESKSVSHVLERQYSTGITIHGKELDIRPHH